MSDETKRYSADLYWAAGAVRLALVGCLALLMFGGVASADIAYRANAYALNGGGSIAGTAGTGGGVTWRAGNGGAADPLLPGSHRGRGGSVDIEPGDGDPPGDIKLGTYYGAVTIGNTASTTSITGHAKLNGHDIATTDMLAPMSDAINHDLDRLTLVAAMGGVMGAFLVSFLIAFWRNSLSSRRAMRLRAWREKQAAKRASHGPFRSAAVLPLLFLLESLSACTPVPPSLDIAPTWDASTPDLEPDHSLRLEAKCPPNAPVYNVERDCCHSKEGECPDVRVKVRNEPRSKTRIELCGMVYTAVENDCDIIVSTSNSKRSIKAHPVRLVACDGKWIATDAGCAIRREPKQAIPKEQQAMISSTGSIVTVKAGEGGITPMICPHCGYNGGFTGSATQTSCPRCKKSFSVAEGEKAARGHDLAPHKEP